MASEIRVDKINSLSGVGTVTLSPTGVDIAGITTTATLRSTTGIVTNFTANAVNIGIDTGVYGEDLVVTGNTRVTGITTFGDSDNPSLMLNIDATSGSPAISIPDSIIHSGDTNTKIRFPAADTITAETAGSERLRITSAGILQVKGEDDQDNLSVSANNNTEFAVHQDDTDGEVSLRSQDPTGSNNAKYMTFYTHPSGSATTERIRITSGGDVGVNVTSPGAKLDTSSGSDSAMGLRVSGGASGGTNIALFRTHNGTTRFTVNNDVTVNTGNLVIGTAGKGINFSATGDGSGTDTSELLDDYEEGTWTASVTGGAITTNAAYYTKIGRLVSWYLYAKITNTANDANQFRIYGLPYTVLDGSYYGNAGVFTYTQSVNAQAFEGMGVLAHNASTYIYFHFVGRGDSNPPVNSYFHAHMLNQNFIIAGSYYT